MLVLTRRKEETIVIGDSIEITVLGIRGEQVRLGISAPPEVPVHRKEVYDNLGLMGRRTPSALLRFCRGVSRLWRGRSTTNTRKHLPERPGNRNNRNNRKNRTNRR